MAQLQQRPPWTQLNNKNGYCNNIDEMPTQSRGTEFSLLTVWLDISVEAPVEEIKGLVAALPQGQEDCNATGREGNDEGQHDREAEVALAPIRTRRQRQQGPSDVGQNEGENGTYPNLHHTIPDCLNPCSSRWW